MAKPHRHRTLVEIAASVHRADDPNRSWLREAAADQRAATGEYDFELAEDGQSEVGPWDWLAEARKLCPPDPVPPESPVERERRAMRGMGEALKRLSKLADRA